MEGGLTMKIYYRGYVIDEEIRSNCYTVYGRRPVRAEMTVHADAQKAMKWIDGDAIRRLVNHQDCKRGEPSPV